MRKPLIVLLGLGVLAGYGSAFSHMRYRMHHGYEGGGCDRWSQRYEEPAPVVTAPAVAPAPAPAVVQQQPQVVMPQIIIVQPQAAPAAAAPTVIVQPQAPAAPAPTVYVQPAPAEMKKAEQPGAKPPTAE